MSDIPEGAVGKVADYFWKREVVRIKVLDGEIDAGDQIDIRGEFSDVSTTVEEMEIDDDPVNKAEAGDTFAMPLPMSKRVMLGDYVFPSDS